MTPIENFCGLQNYTIIKELNWEFFVHYNTLKLHGEISKYKKIKIQKILNPGIKNYRM